MKWQKFWVVPKMGVTDWPSEDLPSRRMRLWRGWLGFASSGRSRWDMWVTVMNCRFFASLRMTTRALLFRGAGIEALEIRARLGVLRIYRECVFEVAACRCRLAGLRVKDAEVAPAVGVFLVDVQSSLLLGDGGGEIATRGEQLRE
jgi:hypothetical protein